MAVANIFFYEVFMSFIRTLSVIAVSTAFLTGCGGPSEDDCIKGVNEFLQKEDVTIAVPGEIDKSYTKDNYVFIIPVPTGDPLTNGDKSLLNEKYHVNYGNDDYKEQFEQDIKIAREFEKAGYMKIKEGIFDKLDKTSFMDDGTVRKIAGYQIVLTDKIKPYYQEASFLFKPRITIGNFAVDKITSIDSNPQKYGGFEVYSFTYTQKVENLLDGLSSTVVDLIKSDSGFKHDFKEHSAQILKQNSEWKIAH